MLARAGEQHASGLSELRALARGIHPTVLTEHGLEAALTALAQRAPLPVELHVAVPDRLDPTIEAAACFLVSEALTNVAKHAQANRVSVDIATGGVTLEVTPTTAPAVPMSPKDPACGAWSIASPPSAVGWT